jgi:cellulose biosynthesis protein BcsQ
MIVAVDGLKGGLGKPLVSIHLAGEALARAS